MHLKPHLSMHQNGRGSIEKSGGWCMLTCGCAGGSHSSLLWSLFRVRGVGEERMGD